MPTIATVRPVFVGLFMASILVYLGGRLTRCPFDRLSGISLIFSASCPRSSCQVREVLTVVQLEPLSRATAKRVSVAVAQLELDVLVISFNGFRTDPKFLRDPARSETGAV